MCNYGDISSSSNLPEVAKQAKLIKQQAHLDLDFISQNMVKDAKAAYNTAGCPSLGPHPPCSTNFAVHLSFDYAQQVHLPLFPMQPGPLYFLVPRKVGIFGVCMEGIPLQVNYLIDESHCSSNAVISYLHHYVENYGLGEKEVHLHCDNCSDQNKYQYVLAYLMWRVLTGCHKSISLNLSLLLGCFLRSAVQSHVKTTRFYLFFPVTNFIATVHSVFHKIGSSRETDTILGLNEAYNLYFHMMC